MAKLSYLEAIHQGLDQAMERDKDVFVLGEDVGKKGGVFGVTLGLQAKYGEARVLDTPLAESNIVGTSIGASRYVHHLAVAFTVHYITLKVLNLYLLLHQV